MEFLVGVLIVILLIRWAMLSGRLRRMEERIAQLTRRVWELEGHEVVPPEPPPLPEVIPEPEPVPAEPSRAAAPAVEWEVLVGGNLLNKLGALVLVVGIALFLAYSFTKMGPWGRVGTGLAVSSGLLAAGIVVERRAAYRVFARGLIAAGWAGLYFTVYAMGAVTAAKVIGEPVTATLLLLGTGAGMLLHSLRYESQAATSLSYFCAFAALALSESTALAVVALVPLSASLVYLAHKKDWGKMAVFGLAATYGVCISRGDSGAPLWNAQALFLVYWVIFEAYDILRRTRLIFGLNALLFFVLSYLKWWDTAAHDRIWMFFAGNSVLYLGGALLRGPCYPRALSVAALMAVLALIGATKGVVMASGLALEAALLFDFGLKQKRKLIRFEGYVVGVAALIALAVAVGSDFHKFAPVNVWGPVALAAAAGFALAWRAAGAEFEERRSVMNIAAAVGNGLAMLALWCLLPDVLVALGWMALGLVFAGMTVPGLSWQGQALATAAFGRLFFANFTNGGETLGVSHRVLTVTPVVACLYGLRKRWFLWLAAIAIAVLLRFELGRVHCAVGWAAAAVVFLRLGGRDFRWQSLAFAGMAALRGAVTNLNVPASLAVIAAMYGCEFLSRERSRVYYSLLGTALASVVLYNEVSGSLLTVAWGLQGTLLLAAGFPLKERVLRFSGLALLMGCILKLFVYDLRNLETFYRILSFLALGVILMGVSWVYARVRRYL